MTDILFGQSYFLRFDPKLWEAMQPYPPLGTLYAASYLRQGGHQVALFDAMLAESTFEWKTALKKHRPKYAVIYEDNFNYLSKMCLLNMRHAAYEMIEMGKKEGCTVIVGGSDATDHHGSYISAGADFVLLGEGEETLLKLIEALEHDDTSFNSILGLAYKSENQIQKNSRRPDINNLDALPFPAWDLVDIDRYRTIWMDRHGYFSMNMVTTRGCPFHCNWCAKPIWGQRYNSRSPGNVVAEIKWIKEMFNPDHLWFADDIMGLKPGWLPGFANTLKDENLSIPFKSLSRADLLIRDGEVDALREAGSEIVWMGAESGAQHILDAMDKGTRIDQIYQASALLHKAGIKVGYFLQFGYPGETREDIERTIQLVRDGHPDDIGISVSYPLPGTKFYDAVQSQMREKENWSDSRDLEMLFQGPFSTAFYRQLHKVVHKEFRARKTWRLLLAGKPPALRRIAAMIYHWISLPLERKKLDGLSLIPVQGIQQLQSHMPPDEAARPSLQD